MAVSRWKVAKNRHRPLADRFIDLRNALESLFLPEKPSRVEIPPCYVGVLGSSAKILPIGGAFGTRCGAPTTLPSAAVHQGHVKDKVKGKASSVVLGQALAVCRRGILRVLARGRSGTGLHSSWTAPTIRLVTHEGLSDTPRDFSGRPEIVLSETRTGSVSTGRRETMPWGCKLQRKTRAR